MKVHNHDSTKLTGIRSKSVDHAAGKSRGAAAGAHSSSRTDEALAASYTNLINRAKDLEDPARTARVVALQGQIAAGQYQVDPGELSKSLVKSALGESWSVRD